MRGAFPSILNLIPKCEKVKKLSAICKLCKESASFTFRTAGNASQKMIGGDEMYMPLCRTCHARETKLNKGNAFVGDPSKISVEVEEKEQPKLNGRLPTNISPGKENIFDSSTLTPDTSDGTVGDSNESDMGQAALEVDKSNSNGQTYAEPMVRKFSVNQNDCDNNQLRTSSAVLKDEVSIQ